jgi:hypothetical protein
MTPSARVSFADPDGFVAISLAAHGRLDAVTVEDLAIGSAGVLDAAVGMVDESSGWRAMLDCHHQRVFAQRTP